MTQKLTMIIGVPATGKSALIRALLDIEVARHYKVKWTPNYLFQDHKCCLFGEYVPGEKYPGTDRLSMAVQPHAIEFISKNHEWNFLFEGDRLGNLKLIDSLRGPNIDIEVIKLQVDPVQLSGRRRNERGDQTSVFWMSRRTKVRNIVAGCHERGIRVLEFPNNNLQNQSATVDYLQRNRM